MDVCAETTVRLFFTILKFLIENWGWTITLLGIAVILQRFPYILSGLSWLVNNALDFIGTGTGFIGSLLVGFIPSVFIGFIWSAIILGSEANIFLRIIASPFAFLVGFIWGYLPTTLISLVPMALGMEILGKRPNFANAICIILIALGATLPIILGIAINFIGSLLGIENSACEMLNNVIIDMSH